jgi:hypothetical protein
MGSERRAILSMIATGCITPREAERLLAVVSGADETLPWLEACGALVWLTLPQMHAAVSEAVRWAALCAQWMGGVR